MASRNILILAVCCERTILIGRAIDKVKEKYISVNHWIPETFSGKTFMKFTNGMNLSHKKNKYSKLI